MKDPIITYRGASCPLSELSDERVDQLQQQQGTRQVQYRGVTAEVNMNESTPKKKQTIQYRGATMEIEL